MVIVCSSGNENFFVTSLKPGRVTRTVCVPCVTSVRVIIPDDVKERLETKTSQMVRVTINTDLSEE